MINLSNKAIDDLRATLKKEVDLDVVDSFSNEDLNRIGNFLLTVTVEYLKMDVNRL